MLTWMVLEMPLINIEITKYEDRDEWYYIADVSSNKLSRHERVVTQDLLSSIAYYVKMLSFKRR